MAPTSSWTRSINGESELNDRSGQYLYQRGALLLDQLVTETFDFGHIGKAVEYCAGQNGARAVVLS
ncbi:hypothetical protein ACIA5H_23315 [Nocardia sp. NPDC051900]|uniref:hypothetical protein n=1 Tax=Nocardia sp. NPDC051900 TaxID=3364326 RepID=UPI0037A816EF